MRVRARAGLRGRVGGVSAGYLARLIGGSMPAGVVVVTWLGLGLGSRLASPNPNPNQGVVVVTAPFLPATVS